ncbi:hypothetical protein SAMN03080617_03569 [Algoriphagus alkaliphilus]|uniref:Uncharacterized protein n=1 Tax=Algoriphagus alkaliphilus TaxID=279824 RepID=A0A1G5ZCU5_9BACT|nr:hypothetical protein SAMN03080617_03569 [Algoriphagus alkaliphilus]
MKKLKISLATIFCLALSISPMFVNAQNCGTLASGYNIRINGTNVCVLNNASRECFAIINPCPEQ